MDSFSAKKPRRLRQNIQQGRTDSFAFCHDGTKLRCCRRLAGGKQQSAGLLQSSNRRIRSPAGEPRPGKQSTGLFAWTGLSNPSPKQKRDTPEGVSLFWWGRTDSNHRSETQQIYSLSPLATRELPHIQLARLEPVDGLEPPTY